MIVRATVDPGAFNPDTDLPYQLRHLDFEGAMQDVYDFFFDVNTFLRGRGLARLDETLRPANMSGVITDMLTASLAKHSRSLVVNRYPNGHPDLLVGGSYPGDAAKSAERGVEVKTTRKPGGAVDMHGSRPQTICVFVYQVDDTTQPVDDRHPLLFREVYIQAVDPEDFRHNARGELGTRTATLHKLGLQKLRANWVYLLAPTSGQRVGPVG